jgi:integrase
MVRLLGHGSKKMVYDVYGNYVDGLENDVWDIANYFGRDFITVKNKPLSFSQLLSGESLGESQGFDQRNNLILLNN